MENTEHGACRLCGAAKNKYKLLLKDRTMYCHECYSLLITQGYIGLSIPLKEIGTRQ